MGQVAYRSNTIRFAEDLSEETLQVRRVGGLIFSIFKKTNANWEFYIPSN